MELKINDYKLLCNKGSAKFNEDIIGLTPYGTWVLDGATGLNNKNLISNESDAKWYVNWWNRYLHANIHKELPLKDVVKIGVETIKKEYFTLLKDNKVENLDFPSCAAAILKFHKDKIEYILLGDCTLFVQDKENFKVFKDLAIEKLDKMVYDAMDNLENSKDMTLDEKKAKVMPIIINNRLKKNTIGGYWSLEFSTEAIDNCLSGFIDIKDNTQIMLTSDGFSCACDRYGIFNKEDMLNIASEKGIDYIYSKIRNLENEDNMSIKFSRFKISDDSSCVYLDIYK